MAIHLINICIGIIIFLFLLYGSIISVLENEKKAAIRMLIILFLIVLMPLSLSMGTQLDYAKLFSGAFGLFLMLAAFSSAGLYMSSLTENPMIAAISTFGVLLMLWMINTNGASASGDANVLSYLSLHTHFAAMLRGILNTRDIAYFLLFIFGFIVLAIRQLETQRLQS